MSKKYKFSGDDYVEARDLDPLSKQIDRVLAVMMDQKKRSVAKLQQRIIEKFGITDPENSLQAQLRNLRKADNGGYEVPRFRIENGGRGYYVYKLGKILPVSPKVKKLAKKSKAELIALVIKQKKKIRKMNEQLQEVLLDVG
jgi:hypothetical protein